MSIAFSDPDLPRLLYIGDVPVESSYHGSALLFRLLCRYPAASLRILESNLARSLESRRLPGVTYGALHLGAARPLTTRFHSWYARWLLMRARGRSSAVDVQLCGFHPDVVMTVGHGYLWMTAAQYAKEHGRPLHLVMHDDWPTVVAPQLRRSVEREFGAVYRQAAARYCTSPFMVEEYERRYGVKGTLLLPFRAPGAPRFDGVAPRLRDEQQRLRFAFAGTINSQGYARLLRALAVALQPHGAELLVFGPVTRERAQAEGLDLPNVTLGGLLSSEDVLRRLRDDSDVLFVPMSFDEHDHANMRMGFPSKLTDYTSVGLPLLVCGPPDSSVVTWAAAHDGVAEVVTAEEHLPAAVARLHADQQRRIRLARQAMVTGDAMFSIDAAESILAAGLKSAAGAGH